jgi:hypothetical protein
VSFLDDYEPVEDRLAKFWKDNPEGQIDTELVRSGDGEFIVKASVWKSPTEGRPDATGLAHEQVSSSGVNKTSALENCETSAIGRALANLGYAPKGKRPSREEMSKTQQPERTDPKVKPSEHLATLVEAFGLWTPEQRREAYTLAMTELGFQTLATVDRADAVFEKMTEAYYLAFPDVIPF